MADPTRTSPYRNEFAVTGYKDDSTPGWKRVQEEFGTDVPEPHEVIYADYEYACYEGNADVLWRNADGTFGYVSGGHCSCYGLEGQWQPETYTAEYLREQAERANYGFFQDQRELILKVAAAPE